MEVMEEQVDEKEEVAESPREAFTSDSDVISECDVSKAPQQANGHLPQSMQRRSAVQTQPTNQTTWRLQNELEERAQLISDLQGHLASSRNEVALKDETLARLEAKLEAARRELADVGERLAQADGERAAFKKQNEMLQAEVAELGSRVEETTSVSQRLEREADQQMEQITDLQERLLASETHNKELTAKCVEKDMEIGRQWTTISSLQQALLESKQQAEALQPGPSFLSSLLGGGVRPKVENI
ncbi:serine/threonine-protein kinase mrck-1-like isoform X2 [Pollicipes pollicipes]|uniref:serine/threonine-protein kinase mrck-1-like isoform X2 n=1 Tax=Pollicipes pollicipes TaxID=41117 RepID=UPI0018859A0B|nr:serine/threonine-protein kinase mrck-1-like isoform X2 [Pollicipes pollicipes]